MATNTFRPAGLQFATLRTAPYHSNDVPVDVSGGGDPNALRQSIAYEWFDRGSDLPGTQSGWRWRSNPPFMSRSAGVLMETLTVNGVPGGQPARILRGFIRRTEYSVNDVASMSRLYFMFNPENIQREYMSYLDQGALDPFNTVFQSGNLVAPPSILNFEFELFFDRQDEARLVENPGVLVDYEFFDLVVRNVKPGQYTNGQLPDNGVMMVNPRDITVVFSPNITVQGRPLNASVSFEKFTHRMIPTRMRIRLTMRVVYFGPLREVTTFVPEETRALESIPFPIKDPVPYKIEFVAPEWPDQGQPLAANTPNTTLTPNVPGANDVVPTGNTAAEAVNVSVVNHIQKRIGQYRTGYSRERREQLWKFADCSSLIWGGYAELGHAAGLGWVAWANPDPNSTATVIHSGIPGYVTDTTTMWIGFNRTGDNHCLRLWGWPNGKESGQWPEILRTMHPGDLLIRYRNASYNADKQHIAIVKAVGTNSVTVIHAASEDIGVLEQTYTQGQNEIHYNYGVRPVPAGFNFQVQPNTPAS